MSAIKARLTEDMKTAMKSGDKSRLGVIRLLLAALKQKEVDERIVLSDEDVLGILTKQAKQRRESIAQFQSAGRQDLVDAEQAELVIIESYLPASLDEPSIRAVIQAEIAVLGATGVAQMGAVMNAVRGKLAGRADMAQVSQWVKAALTST
ncbi:GatB/YqeY domain-containing protein [Halothiobacillus sp. DCM-1]|uniref:GatB/YqeY domain-containing protein n=1 Tax=Halothiobacillus sp. DCM-1 TaxID=3112558 RepID=UPI00324A9C3F